MFTSRLCIYSNLKHKFLLLSPPYLGLLIHLYIFQYLHNNFHRCVYISIMFEFFPFHPIPISYSIYPRSFLLELGFLPLQGLKHYILFPQMFFANWFIFHPNRLHFYFHNSLLKTISNIISSIYLLIDFKDMSNIILLFFSGN